MQSLKSLPKTYSKLFIWVAVNENVTHFILIFLISGHFLLLKPSSAAEASGSCEFHLTSPIMPGSDRHCMLQVALYESGPALGNLTLLIKPILSDAAVHSVALNRRRRVGHRSELSMLLQWCMCRILIYPDPNDICTVAQCVHLISVKKQKPCLISDWSACQVEVQPVKRMK